MATVSIVMSCLNAQRFLKEAIESCLQQTYQDIELIIVIDGDTTDNTYQIAAQYLTDTRVKIIQCNERMVIPVALNEGFKHATGKYYTFLHADDIFALHAIETMLQVLEADKSIDALYTDHTVIDEEGNIKAERKFSDINDGIYTFTGAGLGLLYRKELFEKMRGYDVDSYLCEDYIFWIRAWLIGKIIKLNRADLHFYRVNKNSLSQTKRAIVFTKFTQTFEGYLNKVFAKTTKEDTCLLLAHYAKYYSCDNIHLQNAAGYVMRLAMLNKPMAIKTCFSIFGKRSKMFFKGFIFLPMMLNKVMKVKVKN